MAAFTDQEVTEIMARIQTARKAITDKHGTGTPERTLVGFMPCPVCDSGRLRYRIREGNGHIHADCTTAGCVSWRE